MSNKLTDKATSTTTPTNWFVNIAGTVKQFTAAAFSSLIGALIGPQTNAATGKSTPVDADKLPLSDSADSNATKHTTWANIKATLGALFAPLASPALTGTPTAPTAAAATNTTQIATTAFVRTEVANLVASAPGVLDTLDELAAALGDDANFAATVTSALAGKAASSHAHAIADTTGLQAALDAKAATSQKLDDFGTPDDNTDLDATIGRHGLLPKLGGGTTNFLRADGTWAAPAGGGGALDFPKTLFVSASLGNDGTAEIGNPALPYATAQAAFDDWLALASAGCMHIMDGNAGGIILGADMTYTLHITGNGPAFCFLGGLLSSGAEGETGAEDQNGGNGTPGWSALFSSDLSVNFGSISGLGGGGGSGGTPMNTNTNGGAGGAAPTMRLFNILCDALEIRGGNGGGGGNYNGSDEGGSGGDLYEIIISGVVVRGDTIGINIYPGSGGSGSMAGGEGNPGMALVMASRVTQALNVTASSGVVANNIAYSLNIAGGVSEGGNYATGQVLTWP